MSLGLTFVMYGSLFCLSFYARWSHFHYILVMCCLSFYVTWFHFRSVCVLSLFAILALFYLYVRDCVTADITFSGRSLPSDVINLYLDSCFSKTNIKMYI